MKIKFFAVLAGVALVGLALTTTGCVRTVSNTHSLAITWSRDTITGRYNRSVDQVYHAAVVVIQNNGVLTTEYIPHDNTNDVRSLAGKVNQKNVWIRVESVDPQITQVDVEARSSWGVSDVQLSAELEKEIALQLAR